MQRAWTAGAWVGEGQIGSPIRSRATELPNQFWCVLFCERLPAPVAHLVDALCFSGQPPTFRSTAESNRI